MSNSVYIVSTVRSPIAKGGKGALRDVRPDDVAIQVVKGALAKVPSLPPEEIGDLVLGCSFPEGEQGFNVGRIVALGAGLPDTVAGMTINRFCASGLQSIVIAINAIAAGQYDAAIAGGVESMSRIPMGGASFLPNPSLVESRGETYDGMGITAERVAAKYEISREAQDEFALLSHQRAIAAIQAGRFVEEIIPITIKRSVYRDFGTYLEESTFSVDEGPRADTSLAALAKLKPAFKVKGTVTAGNSSQVSDGAAATVLVNERVLNQYGLTPLAKLVSFAVAGNEPGLMGIAPIYSIPKALDKANLTLKEIRLIEMNEAFAAQSLAVRKVLGIEESVLNVNGGAIAIGHPLGCTGAALVAKATHQAIRENIHYFMCTMCVGGGMGATAIFENLMYRETADALD